MEIKFNLTEKDYLHFNLFHIKNSKMAIKSLNIQRVIGPVIFIVFSIVFSWIEDTPLLWGLVPFAIISVLWIIFYPKYFYSTIIRRTKKMINEGKNEGLFGEHQMIMTDKGLIDLFSESETKVSWSGIHSFKEYQYSFYLYTSSVSACILPKGELKNAEEIRNYLESKIKQ